MPAAPAVRVEGLDDFRRDLKQLEGASRWNKELGKAQRTIGTKVAGWSASTASGMGGPFAHFAGAIKGAGGATGAKVSVAAQANATFWGAKKNTGWNVNARPGSRPQHPAWVGASWEAGVAGQGPYAINNTIAAHTDDILRMYGEAVDQVAADAFNYTTSTF